MTETNQSGIEIDIEFTQPTLRAERERQLYEQQELAFYRRKAQWEAERQLEKTQQRAGNQQLQPSLYSTEGEKRKAKRNRKSSRALAALLAKHPSVTKLDFWSSLNPEEQLRLLTYAQSILLGTARNEIGEPEESEVALTPFREV